MTGCLACYPTNGENILNVYAVNPLIYKHQNMHI